jgi:[DsrC]-trisulfide reductase subunit O
MDRRGFIKLAGAVSIAGLAGRPLLGALAADQPGGTLIEKPSLVGKRWAMAIDSKKCLEKEGCRDCIAACHHIHNVPEFDNAKDEIKWIWKEKYEHVFPDQENEYIEEQLKDKSVLVFCNHCDNPPCVRVCPTQATWKREDGIVMMDWHRCIGCRYCMAACPYGSRSFNWRDPRPFIKELVPDFPNRTRGVVEKCNFCEERLAGGLIPACVEACPEKALVFGDLEDSQSELRELLRTRFSIRRKPNLGTQPELYYIV